MYPSLGELVGFEIRSYTAIRWAYFATAIALTAFLARRQEIRPTQIVRVFLVTIPAALIGGHLLNVFEAWPTYRGQPGRLLEVVTGGSSIYGAMLLGIGAAVSFMRWQRIPILAVLDAGAPAMALGEAITRVGCFLAGCCYGHPTQGPLGVTFPRESPVFQAQLAAGLIEPGSALVLPVHPTQLYSAAISAGLFVALLRLVLRGGLFPGAVFCIALAGYGVQRLLVGGWRADAAAYWWEVSAPLSVATIVLACLLSFRWRGQSARSARSDGAVTVRIAERG